MKSMCYATTSSTNYMSASGATSEIGHVIVHTHVITVRQTISPNMRNSKYSGVSPQRQIGLMFNETATMLRWVVTERLYFIPAA